MTFKARNIYFFNHEVIDDLEEVKVFKLPTVSQKNKVRRQPTFSLLNSALQHIPNESMKVSFHR